MLVTEEQNVTFCIQELKEHFSGEFQQLNLVAMGSFELFLEFVTNLFTKLPLLSVKLRDTS